MRPSAFASELHRNSVTSSEWDVGFLKVQAVSSLSCAPPSLLHSSVSLSVLWGQPSKSGTGEGHGPLFSTSVCSLGPAIQDWDWRRTWVTLHLLQVYMTKMSE